jgi:hypothetical protein
VVSACPMRARPGFIAAPQIKKKKREEKNAKRERRRGEKNAKREQARRGEGRGRRQGQAVGEATTLPQEPQRRMRRAQEEWAEGFGQGKFQKGAWPVGRQVAVGTRRARVAGRYLPPPGERGRRETRAGRVAR